MMTSHNEFRRYLDEALRSAERATTPEDRASFLQMAKIWHEAALEEERSMGPVAERRHLLDRNRKTTRRRGFAK
jgi:hypothetical protein